VSPPGVMDRVLGNVVPAVVTFVAFVLLVSWLVDALLGLWPTWPMLTWMVIASAICAVAATIDFDHAGRLTVALFIAAVIVPVPERLRNLRGAFVLLGVP